MVGTDPQHSATILGEAADTRSRELFHRGFAHEALAIQAKEACAIGAGPDTTLAILVEAQNGRGIQAAIGSETGEDALDSGDETAAQSAYPEPAGSVLEERANPVVAELRSVRLIEDFGAHTVEAGEAVYRSDPEVTVLALDDCGDVVVWKSRWCAPGGLHILSDRDSGIERLNRRRGRSRGDRRDRRDHRDRWEERPAEGASTPVAHRAILPRLLRPVSVRAMGPAATWAIGDVHGCYRTLRKLLKKIDFARSADRLWFAGDLVNRGPRSLEVLEWAADHDWRIESVLGNHDLHLLAVAFGVAEERPRDTLRPILKSSRQVPLVDWLRRRPLAVGSPARLMIHAGLLPAWTAEEALSIAARLERRLRGEEAAQLLSGLRRKGARAEDETAEVRALRVFALARTLRSDGKLCREFAGPPQEAPKGCRPWFDLPDRQSVGTEVIFGHWAAAGFWRAPGLLALDSGCAWGGKLTAVRLEDGECVQAGNSE